MGDLITIYEHWGNFAGTSKRGKLYESGWLIICEPYESEEENENTGHRGTSSD
ncbi:hypothetical protein [Geobacillus subterraneus]|uniref:hypothetical protein n=1 Tax=Geobacillus subterraneus TaxID=129338 RepID=UPI001609705F